MAWYDFLTGKKRLETKENPVAQLYVQGVGTPVWTDVNYVNLATEGYQQNPIVYTCTKMIADASANLTLNFFNITKEQKKEIDQHPVKSLIMNPSPSQGSIAFLRDLHSYLNISGNAYIMFIRGIYKDPIEMYVLRSDRVQVIPNAKGEPEKYRYSADGKHADYDASEILHIKLFNPLNDWYGYSGIQAAAKSIDVHNGANAYNKALLDNSARPSGALVYQPKGDDSQNLTDQQYSRLKKQLLEVYSGPSNAGKPMLLDGGLAWQSMSVSQKDMQFIENKDQAAREIAICLGVPPLMLGIKGDSTYSNFAEANRAFYRQTVIPTANFVLKEFERYFKKQYPELFIEVDEDTISALATERTELWDRVGKAEFISANEKRSLTGYESYQETDNKGDTILVDGGKVPIDEAGFMQGGGEPK